MEAQDPIPGMLLPRLPLTALAKLHADRRAAAASGIFSRAPVSEHLLLTARARSRLQASRSGAASWRSMRACYDPSISKWHWPASADMFPECSQPDSRCWQLHRLSVPVIRAADIFRLFSWSATHYCRSWYICAVRRHVTTPFS